MLLKRLFAKNTRGFWIAFVLLSPIAYVAGSLLGAKYDLAAQTHFTFDRTQAIALGIKYAAERSLDVRGWDTFLQPKFDNSLLFYYRSRSREDLTRLHVIAPPVSVAILFRSPDRRQSIELNLTPDGKLIGFSRRFPSSLNLTDPGETVAKSRAESTLSTWLQPEEITRLIGPEIEEDRTGNTIKRRYIWKLPIESRPELNIQYQASVHGDRIVQETFDTTLSEGFSREHKLGGGFTLKVSGTPASGLDAISLVLYYLAITFVVILGLYRFIQRARQRELSYQRIALFAIFIASLFLSIILLTDVATYKTASTNDSGLWPIYVFATISYLFMGLFVALAYGSGEGDLREAYPGKLTSLDALIIGRIFSRNVARAVVIGAVFAGWGLFCLNLVPFLWRNQPGAGKEIEMLDFLVGRLPWLSPLVLWPFKTILIATTVILLPLPFLTRRFRNQRLVISMLALFGLIITTGETSSFTPWIGSIIIGAITAATLLVPFFMFDLLTALVSLAGTRFFPWVIQLIAQPSLDLRRSGYISMGIAFAFLIIEIYFAYHGRIYSEEEVGPQYARHLAERLAMQAEVSAAREAQMRLLPEALPTFPYLAIAAECRPAHEVGGDFYEIFQLDENRIGIFIAEGGGRGLASALSIAFAKGFLMPKICGRGDHSPTEIARGLQAQLWRMLERVPGTGFIYAVVDSVDKTLRYARTGSYPRIIIGHQSTDFPHPLDEQESTFDLPSRLDQSMDDSFTVFSGMYDLEPGDSILFFTDGIATAFSDVESTEATDLWKEIKDIDSPQGLNRALHNALDLSSKRAYKLGIADDLTAMIIRIKA